MNTDDSMSDDVFESEDLDQLHTPVVPSTLHPSPTGYRGYQPPADLFKDPSELEQELPHKTILLGDSGVGKTSLLVQFDTGKFQTGTFSATVGIGFTFGYRGKMGDQQVERRQVHSRPQWTSLQSNGGSPASPCPPPSRPVLSPSQVCDLVCKVMLLGDSGVGKTCLLVRFRDNLFLSGNFISTVGIDFRNKVVSVDDSKVKLQIWDTAGQERFRSVTHAYYRDAHALLLLYDVTSKTSFDNIRAWLGEIKEYAQDDVVIMLLGNKADCQNSERMIRREDGERLAKEYTVTFMETSAKTGMNVELAFMAIARELKSRKCGNPDNTVFNVQEYVREQTQRGSCPPCNT